MSLIKDRQFENERRGSKREKREFSVQINNKQYEGLDVSGNGFSIVCSGQEAFLLSNQFSKVLIESDAVSYEVSLAQVRSYRNDGFNKIYGFSIVSIKEKDKINHNFLFHTGAKHSHIKSRIEDKPIVMGCDSIEIPIAAFKKMQETLDEEMFDSDEKLTKIRGYLTTIQKKHKLNPV